MPHRFGGSGVAAQATRPRPRALLPPPPASFSRLSLRLQRFHRQQPLPAQSPLAGIIAGRASFGTGSRSFRVKGARCVPVPAPRGRPSLYLRASQGCRAQPALPFCARYRHTSTFPRASAAPASSPAAYSLAVLLFFIVRDRNADFVSDVDAIRVDGFPTRLAECERQRKRQRRKLAVLFAVAVRYAERHKDAVRLRLLPGCAARVQRPTDQQ